MGSRATLLTAEYVAAGLAALFLAALRRNVSCLWDHFFLPHKQLTAEYVAG